ncbi:TetR/AcrR family transcriptional regulator [Photobacterium sp. TLY01]|uniref:TetR/AcrR family transcriptional regulator n=1 Tax=Photobacterium sp. TLY01 TaxID=2907534 RepID=UPI001F42610B|nr:TetR/AcrR family transcriptional regulator [Photobacterium sp. TLY01]UIP26746.1 TetR/AcrR family transcriptional regulator [Photobacterium sp. TLY01]
MMKKEQTKRRIQEAAWQLFRENGYQDTTTRHIAERAEVAAGTVFSHFPTKLDLLKAGLSQQIDHVLAAANTDCPETGPKEKLMHFAGYLYAFYCLEADFSRELFRVLIWQQEEFEQQLETFRQRLFSHEPSYDQQYAAVMMDCYFMTLITGLNAEKPDAAFMLNQLEKKLDVLQ